MTCLKPLLPLALTVLATPAFAQMTISIASEEPSASSSEMSLSLEASSSEPSSSKMSEPPVLSSSSEVSSEIDNSITNPSIEPPPPLDVAGDFKIFYDTCTSISGGDPDAFDKANDAGWVPYDGTENGPFKRVYTGARDLADIIGVELWGSYETYPTQSLGYCRVDFGDYETAFDLEKINGLEGLTGQVGGGGAYGVWESADKKLLVIAARVEGSLSIEFNVLVGDTP